MSDLQSDYDTMRRDYCEPFVECEECGEKFAECQLIPVGDRTQRKGTCDLYCASCCIQCPECGEAVPLDEKLPCKCAEEKAACSVNFGDGCSCGWHTSPRTLTPAMERGLGLRLI